jgi:hypothetical protein
MKPYIYTILFLAACASACSTNGKFDISYWRKPLEIQRVDNLSDALVLEGIYCNDVLECFFFYRNGVCRHDGRFSSMEHVRRYVLTKGRDKDYMNIAPGGWGVYTIQDTEISLEYWLNTARPCQTRKKYGKILNDSTFTRHPSISGSDTIFKYYSVLPKIDSTNIFIK